jgi:magnesium chelatase family protein
MISRANTVAFHGIDARPVEVQCSLVAGLPAFAIVGLPDKAVSEARERVRAAFAAMSSALPAKRITINLSPADMPKEGSHFDLPIALALLAGIGLIPPEAVADTLALGELSLDGQLMPVTGALPAAMAAASANHQLLCPKGSPDPSPTRRGEPTCTPARSTRHQGPGTGKTRAGDRRRRAPPYADDRASGVG